MLQLKKRSDGALKFRFMATICFYQDTRHDKGLLWIRKQLGIGYIAKRNDGMSEVRVNGFAQVHGILTTLLPYFQFKKRQATLLLKATKILSETPFRMLSEKQKRALVDCIFAIQNENYIAKRKKTHAELLEIVGLTP
jgi:hypothetical protein